MAAKDQNTRHDPYAALRFRDFRLLISGRFIAQIGESMVSTGVFWEIYERTGSEFALGLVGLVQVIPVILLSLPGGYATDRYNRKLLTMYSQIVLMLCSLALMLISVTDGSLVVLYGALTMIGVARAFNNPAESALTPQTIPAEHYYSAATWSSMVWQFSAISGPALAGAIIALTGSAASVYAFNVFAGGVLVAALLMLNIKHVPTEAVPPMESFKQGLHFLRGAPVIVASISLDMFAVLFGGAVALLPVFAKDILQVDAVGYGLLRAAPSVGALCMALYLSRRPSFNNAGRTLLVAVAGFGVATIIFGISTSFWLSLAMLALTGALDNISVVIRHALVLMRTPDNMRGRVNAVNFVFIGASNELGAFESGVAAALLGPVGAVIFGGLGTIGVVGAVAALSPELRNLKTLSEETVEDVQPAAVGEQATAV